jgi:hypothetical protein
MEKRITTPTRNNRTALKVLFSPLLISSTPSSIFYGT